MGLNQDHIDQHFRENRVWKELFLKYYSVYTPANYIELAWKIFEKNGYRYEIERYSNNPDSKVYQAVKQIELYHKNVFIVDRCQVHIDSALEQLLIMVICDFEVDFNLFK